MIRISYPMVIIIFLSYFQPVNAYETRTHAKLSAEAVTYTILNTDSDFLNLINPDPGIFSIESITTLISDGAIYEDDDKRPLNHFYDPVHDIPLRIYKLGGIIQHDAGLRSPDWALEDTARYSDIKGQAYSYSDADNYFFNSLTLPSADKRSLEFTKLFLTLGHVIHHLEDMAQPQHVRNDAHCDRFICFLIGEYSPSTYEKYTGDKYKDINIPFDNRHSVTANKPRDFWVKADETGISQFTNLNFLSAGTNFSLDDSGKINVNTAYQYPQPTGNVTTENLADLLTNQPLTTTDEKDKILHRLGCVDQACTIDFYETKGVDKLTGEVIDNKRAASLSFFDDELTKRDLPIIRMVWDTILMKNVPVTEYRDFTLNKFNFDAAHQFLLPRAIAYSAGLINHFFRGRMSVENVDTNSGQLVISVRNVSQNNRAFNHGTFKLFYDAIDGTRKQDTSLYISNGSLPLAQGSVIELTAGIPPDLDVNKSRNLVVIFDARDAGDAIGDDPGIAADYFDVKLNVEYVLGSSGGGIGDAGRIYLNSAGQITGGIVPEAGVSTDDIVQMFQAAINTKKGRLLNYLYSKYVKPFKTAYPGTGDAASVTLVHASGTGGSDVQLLFAIRDPVNQQPAFNSEKIYSYPDYLTLPKFYFFITSLREVITAENEQRTVHGIIKSLDSIIDPLIKNVSGQYDSIRIEWDLTNKTWGFLFRVVTLHDHKEPGPIMTGLWDHPLQSNYLNVEINDVTFRLGVSSGDLAVLEEFPNTEIHEGTGTWCTAGWVGAYSEIPITGHDVGYLNYSVPSKILIGNNLIELYRTEYSQGRSYKSAAPSKYDWIRANGGCGTENTAFEEPVTETKQAVFQFPHPLSGASSQAYSPEYNLTYQYHDDNSYDVYYGSSLIFSAGTAGAGSNNNLSFGSSLANKFGVGKRNIITRHEQTTNTIFNPYNGWDSCPDIVPPGDLPCTYYYITKSDTDIWKLVSELGSGDISLDYSAIFGNSYIDSLPVGYGHSSSVILNAKTNQLCFIIYLDGYEAAYQNYIDAKNALANPAPNSDVSLLQKVLQDAETELDNFLKTPINDFATKELIRSIEPGGLKIIL